MTRDTYILTCDGAIVPKARPRFQQRSRAVYMPTRYRHWKASAVRSFKAQKRSLGMPDIDYPVRIYVFLWGRHRRSGDMVDNIPGAICDALEKAKIVLRDSAKWMPGAVYDLVWSDGPPKGIIALAPWLPISQSFEQMQEIIAFCPKQCQPRPG